MHRGLDGPHTGEPQLVGRGLHLSRGVVAAHAASGGGEGESGNNEERDDPEVTHGFLLGCVQPDKEQPRRRT